MTVYLSHVFGDSIPENAKENVAQLVEKIGKVEVKSVAQRRLFVFLFVHMGKDLVKGDCSETCNCDIHDNTHALTRCFTVNDKVRSFLCIEVANLEEDHGLYELLDDYECIV